MGVPPFVGVAEKVTLVPAQIAPAGFAEILTLAVDGVATLIVIVLDVAGLPETHEAVLVMTQIIWSLFRSELFE